MIYGYIRVSTDKQTVENQRFEIEAFCEKNLISIDKWIEETISGTKDYTKRALGKILKRLKKDDEIFGKSQTDIKDIDPTSLTVAFFSLAFSNLAEGLSTLFQQKPSLKKNEYP